ncbi:hypothetical protein GCM10027035_02450 [Emticicia sediminis]
MDRKKQIVSIYICSSVGIDYFFFLGKTIAASGFDVKPIYLINENAYRKSAKTRGFRKLFLRFQMYVCYPALLMYKVFTCEKKSIFIVTSNTFYAPFLTKIWATFRKVKVVHLLYDLYPDAIEIAGVIPTNGIISKSIGILTKWNQHQNDATVYLGDFLKKHAERRWGYPKVSRTIDISTDLSLYNNSFVDELPSKKIIIHYGGQLGYLHDAISLIECTKFILESDLSPFFEFNFYVSGAQAKLLNDSLENLDVKVKSAISSELWRSDIREFHIGIVSLSPGGASVCLPSKTYAMMGGGLAIIAIAPIWSDLSNLINRIDAGWTVNNSALTTEISKLDDINYLDSLKEHRDIASIKNDFYNILSSILKNKDLLREKRKNAFDGVRSNYSIDILNSKWEALINEL